MVAEELKVVIRAETAKALRDMKRMETQTGKTGGSMQNLVGTLAKSAAGFAAAAVSVRALAGVAKSSIQAFRVQEQAVAALNAAIIATGKEGEISSVGIQDLASELQRVTTFGDEATISAAALVQQLGNLNEDELRQAIPQVQNFAAAMGMDLNRAASLVARTIGSTTNSLSRYGIEIDNSLRGSERTDAVISALSEKFDGFAESVADTASSALPQLSNALGDSLELFGGFLTEAVEPLARGLTGLLTRINTAAARAGEEIGEIREVSEEELELRTWSDYESAIHDVREEIRELEEATRPLMQSGLVGESPELVEARRRLEELIDAQRNLSEETDILGPMISDINTLTTLFEQGAISEISLLERANQLRSEQRDAIIAAGIEAGDYTEEQIEAINDLNTAIGTSIDRINELSDATDDIDESTSNLSGSTMPQFITELGGYADAVAAARDELAELNRLQDEAAAAAAAAAAELDEAWNNAALDIYETVGNLIIGAMHDVSDESRNMAREVLDNLSHIHEREEAFAKASGATEEELAALKVRQLDEEKAAREEAAREEQRIANREFRANKTRQTAEAIMSGSLAVVRALASPPGPPVSIAYATAAGVAAAAEITAIQMQRPPAFERGGSFVTSGPQTIMVGDGQSPRERVTVEPLSGPYRGSARGGDTININFSGVVSEDNAISLVRAIERAKARGAA